MSVLPYSEYRPDVSDFNGQTSRDIINVFPRGDGYGPIPNFSAITGNLPAACRGAFLARNTDGSVSIFAGTSTKLYKLNSTTGTWTDVSKGGGTYSTLGTQANWQFAQFNNFIFATQQNDKLQIFDVTSSTAFADRADSNCPQAAYVTVVNSFLVLSGILANNAYRVQWSGLNDVSSSSAFTAGVNSSDFQDLADGGLVRGVSGGEYGVIFQDQAIRRLLYAPGSSFIFQIERIASDDGIYTPYSLIRAGNNVFWLSPQGFKILPPGGVPTPIGKERIDRTFFADADFTNQQLIIGANDPANTRVGWAYKSVINTMLTADKILWYDWALDKWTLTSGGGYAGTEYLVSLASPGVTLEGVDAAFGLGTAYPVTSFTTAASGSIFTANQPGTWEASGAAPTGKLTAGMGVQITVAATSTSTLPAALIPNQPYYIAASNLTTTTFSLTTSAGIGTAITTLGTTTLVTLPATLLSSDLAFAVESEEYLSVASLDSISAASLTQLGGVNTSGAFGFFNGPNLQATLETPEQSSDAIGYGTYPSLPGYGGTRLYLRGFRAIGDSTLVFGSASFREGPGRPYGYTTESQSDIRGFIPLRLSTRYSRAKVRIPQATSWSYAAGVEPNVAPEGLR